MYHYAIYRLANSCILREFGVVGVPVLDKVDIKEVVAVLLIPVEVVVVVDVLSWNILSGVATVSSKKSYTNDLSNLMIYYDINTTILLFSFH
jgi:hypothetical protein